TKSCAPLTPRTRSEALAERRSARTMRRIALSAAVTSLGDGGTIADVWAPMHRDPTARAHLGQRGAQGTSPPVRSERDAEPQAAEELDLAGLVVERRLIVRPAEAGHRERHRLGEGDAEPDAAGEREAAVAAEYRRVPDHRAEDRGAEPRGRGRGGDIR